MQPPARNDTRLEPDAPPLTEFPALVQRAAELLHTSGALLNLSPADARCVVSLMTLQHFAKGATLLREGDSTRVDHLLLLLEGEVSVEHVTPGGIDAVAFAVVGPGSVIGEMALLDGEPRSTSCIAVSPVRAAALSRSDLEQLIELHPQIAAKLLVGLATRIANRLRALGDQLQMYAKLAADLKAEVTRLRAPGRR